MGLQHFNYFWRDSEDRGIILGGTLGHFLFCEVSCESMKREQTLTKVTNDFMTQYTIPIDTNQLSKLPSRTDVESWWMINDQTINLRSEHDWTIDVETVSPQNYVGTHVAPSSTHDDDSGVLVSDESYE